MQNPKVHERHDNAELIEKLSEFGWQTREKTKGSKEELLPLFAQVRFEMAKKI